MKRKSNINLFAITGSAKAGMNYNGTASELAGSMEYKSLDWRIRTVIKVAQLIGAGQIPFTVKAEK